VLLEENFHCFKHFLQDASKVQRQNLTGDAGFFLLVHNLSLAQNLLFEKKIDRQCVVIQAVPGT
jgi:hypothetical protein